MLVDPGVHGYTSPEASYLESAPAHNLVSVDGRAATDGSPLTVTAALLDPDRIPAHPTGGAEWVDAAVDSGAVGWSAGMPGHCLGGGPTIHQLHNVSTSACKEACEAIADCRGISFSQSLQQCSVS